ncbi:phage tail family protein [Salinicoccus sp. Marseille-QA3877]
MSSGIKKRTGSEYSDGRPGRINYHSEDEYRTITLLVQSTAYDIQDVAHLRDAVNELFDGELMLREMRIKSVEVEYESLGQRTGEMQLGMPEYVNGKQIKVTMVNSPEIDDTALVSTFTVEFETTESPYFETIYTTLELHDSGYSATAEKYGLVDNIDDEKVKYRFEPQNAFNPNLIPLNEGDWENGSRWSSGTNNNNSNDIRLKMEEAIPIVDGRRYTIHDSSTYNSRLNQFMVHCFDDEGNMTYYFIRFRGSTFTFTARGTKLVISLTAIDGFAIPPDYIEGDRIRMKLEEGDNHTGFEPRTENFTVYNAGNVTVEPESMFLEIRLRYATIQEKLTIRNKTTGDEFEFSNTQNELHVGILGLNVRLGALNGFRYSNRRFISLAPGDNEFEIFGGTFNEFRIDFKYYYK